MSHAAFWKAVCADPDDDTPRLVYADWLDEQGDGASAARAEFVRAQVELVHLDPWTERAIDLKIRERQLLHEHRGSWLDRLPQWIDRSLVTLRRGMPYGIRCRAREFFKNAGGIAKNTPLQEVRLGQLDPHTAGLTAALPHLSRLRELQLFDGSWASWETLLASPHLTGLRELWLFDHVRGLPLGVFMDVMRLPAVRPVQRLHLRLGGQTDASGDLLGGLAGAPLTDLRELDLTAEEMHPQRLAGIFNSPVAARLRAFRTNQNLDDHALDGFATAREAPALRSLAFGVVYASQAELPRVFASPLLRHVEALEVRGLSQEGFAALVASPIVEQLRVLKLPDCHADAWAHRAAFASGRFRGLLELGIQVWPIYVRLDESLVAAIADTPGLESLRHLDLFRHTFNDLDPSLDALFASPHVPNLRAVTLPLGYQRETRSHLTKADAFAAKYASRFAVLVG